MRALDRLLTIIITATLTSAFWIVAGGTLIDRARVRSGVLAQKIDASPPAPQRLDSEGDRPAQSAQENNSLIVPVVGVRPQNLTSTFTQPRAGGARIHEALDIMAPAGTPIVAAASGKIEKLFLSEDGGKTIYIRSSDGRTIYYYAHLQDYQPGLADGQAIRTGQRLGSVGSTGNAGPSGPHLHFAVMGTTPDAEWWEPASPLDPYPLLTAR